LNASVTKQSGRNRPRRSIKTNRRTRRAGPRAWLLLAAACLGPPLAEPASAAEPGPEAGDFAGWQGMRVVRQQGNPASVHAVDLNADGRDTLVVINRRHSRLDLYDWLPVEQREPVVPDPERPNELPAAPELKRTEVTLERLPRDVRFADLTGDGAMELVVLESPPHRVTTYARADSGQWKAGDHWSLLDGQLAGQGRVMHLDPTGTDAPDGPPTVLVSFDEGIQRLPLKPDGRPGWIEPRDQAGRADWWVVDLDDDGHRDVVEWQRGGGFTVRWRRNLGDVLLPAEGLSDVSAQAVDVLPATHGADGGQLAPAELLVLGGRQAGLLRRYQLTMGQRSLLGQRRVLPMANAGRRVWTGIRLAGEPMLALVDPDQPRLLTFRLTDSGWLPGDVFPILSDVRGIASVAAEPGAMLLWTRDAGELHVSRWRDGRMTYPRPRNAAEPTDEAERRILALDRVGRTTWWVRKRGADLHLFRWLPDGNGPSETIFTGVGEKADKAKWLGGERLLVMEQYARSPVLIQNEDGQTRRREPDALSKASLDDYRLMEIDGTYRAARLADGVLQWVDADLNPADQVMLPDGMDLSGYAPIDADHAWALQRGGKHIHRMAADDSGIMRVTDSVEVPGGKRLLPDPVLGLLLIDSDQVVRLSEGRARELEMVASIDSRVGRPSGVREATIHRMWTLDITGDGRRELLHSDDQRHELTALRRDGETMQPLISWPVFEDDAYPYGGAGGSDARQNEPRDFAALDIEGDGARDLAMLLHDRLLLYLGRDGAQPRKADADEPHDRGQANGDGAEDDEKQEKKAANNARAESDAGDARDGD